MGVLTENTPKPLLEVGGKTLLEHNFDALPVSVGEVIIVVGYRGVQIREKFGSVYKDKKISYVEQENPTGGTAQALWLAKGMLREKFLVMNGDNIYAPEDMAACAALPDWSVLVQERPRVGTGRVIVEKGLVQNIAENTDHTGEAGFANTGFYVLDMRIFEYPAVPKAPESTELGLPQTMIQAVKSIPTHAVSATFWIEIKSPPDIDKAEAILAGR
jgi:UDP-N-acetylglucosamine diphosphorylase / glucose-1-phosphate thymidylyltransferase / UDP-N-acetylgalactosamine diphosphorylase / glucosamine-1-phosphate N-acetyltransferase / galactosamine-1-phosphate N-acetyltransferase